MIYTEFNHMSKCNRFAYILFKAELIEWKPIHWVLAYGYYGADNMTVWFTLASEKWKITDFWRNNKLINKTMYNVVELLFAAQIQITLRNLLGEKGQLCQLFAYFKWNNSSSSVIHTISLTLCNHFFDKCLCGYIN